MPDPSSALWNALDSSTPLVIVYYADETRREELIKEVRSLYPPDQEVHCSDNVEDAFRVPHVLLLTPQEEEAALAELDARREQLVDRQLPVVLFVLRGGSAERSLPQKPNIASWVRGSDVDPDRIGTLDVQAARAAFLHKEGCTPEEWLKRRHEDEPKNLETYYRALLLELP